MRFGNTWNADQNINLNLYITGISLFIFLG